MDNKENVKESKDEIIITKDNIKIPILLKEEKYLINIYPSKDNINIVFKLEKEKIKTFYYFEKYDLKDFHQKNKFFLNDMNIHDVFIHLKNIAKKYNKIIENKDIKINLLFTDDNITKKTLIKFTLRKKKVSQERLNNILVDQIHDNKSKLQSLKNQSLKISNSINSKNELIDNIKSSISNLNNTLSNISLLNSNNHANTNSSSTKNSSSNESNSENNSNNNNEDEYQEALNEQDFGQYNNKQENKNDKNNNNNNQNTNDNSKNNETNNNKLDTIFCFDSNDPAQNKKIIELLIILNIVTIIIVLYILSSVYNLRSNLEIDKLREDDYGNRLAYLSFVDDSGDDDGANYGDYFNGNLNYQKSQDEAGITSSKIRDEYLERKRKKMQERIRNYYNY